jgi:S-adenosylmethionine:tRNA ribosyltransferase-isomerase
MRTTDFDFSFPESQIALRPLPRGEARLLVISASGKLPADFPLHPESGTFGEHAFGHAKDLLDILRPGDALALNDTKVLRARLQGTLESGGNCEVLLLKPHASKPSGSDEAVWECMAKPGKKLQPGRTVTFTDDFSAEVLDVLPEGERVLRFNRSGAAFYEALEAVGKIPLPPYIRRDADAEDAETYQTVFAANPGSVAAPTASLHLSESMLAAIEAKGVRIAKVTLHVGAGTFRPVQVEYVEDHPMHSEAFTLSEESARILNETRKSGSRIFAVGTTAARVLETCCALENSPDGASDGHGGFKLQPRSGETSIFIYPGYRWKAVDALLTNFHWPKSTLFMLVAAKLCAIGADEEGIARAKDAYAEAIARGFRLFSYGDGMLILQ